MHGRFAPNTKTLINTKRHSSVFTTIVFLQLLLSVALNTTADSFLLYGWMIMRRSVPGIRHRFFTDYFLGLEDKITVFSLVKGK